MRRSQIPDSSRTSSGRQIITMPLYKQRTLKRLEKGLGISSQMAKGCLAAKNIMEDLNMRMGMVARNGGALQTTRTMQMTGGEGAENIARKSIEAGA